jgi:hypothetical protein
MANEVKRRAFLIGAAGTLLAGCRAALTPTPTFTPTMLPPTSAPPTATALPPTRTPQPTIELPTATVPPPSIEGISDVARFQLPLVTRYAARDRAVLYFTMATGGEVILLVWAEDSPGEVTQVEGAGGLVEITGLTPGTRYKAVVASRDGQALRHPYYRQPGRAWGEVTFTTLSDDVLRVGVIGDAGFGDSTTDTLVDMLTAANLDFVIHTGDVVYKIEENPDPPTAWAEKWYDTFAATLKTSPLYPVMGNHDYDPQARWQGSYYYYEAIPPLTPNASTSQYYSVPLGQTQLIFLDTQVFFGQPGRAEQEAWLDERLADPAFTHTIPVFHVAAYTSGRRRDSDAVPVRQTWGPKFAAAKVPLALSGHDHNYERLIVNGQTYVVSGGGSNVLYDMTEEYPGSQYFARVSHITLLEFHPDRIDLQAVTTVGDVIDEAAIAL